MFNWYINRNVQNAMCDNNRMYILCSERGTEDKDGHSEQLADTEKLT